MHAGTGASGFRNEYLKALLPDFADARAQQAIPLLDQFAESFVNAELPPWFYLVFGSVKEIALIKTPGATSDAAPDVRPLGLGECLRRVITSALNSQHKSVLADHLWPQQVAIGVPGGLSMLLYGLRLMIEQQPNWVIVRLDLRNAYNEVMRSKVLERTNHQPHLRTLVPAMWATYVHESDIYLDARSAPVDFKSAEGMQQGDGLASSGFCVGIHPEVLDLDADVGRYGGAAKFDMDDGYVIGPPDAVFPAVARFALQVRAVGLELQISKCECYSPACDLLNHPLRPQEMHLGSFRPNPGQDGIGHGIPIAGVPVGNEEYIAAYLGRKANQMLSKIETVVTKLRDLHTQSLYTTTLYCLNPMFQYWTQHCYPEDVANHARVVDHAVLAATTMCIGRAILDDDLALRRLRLPPRKFGGGIRTLVDTMPAAFAGTLCRVAPFFANRRDDDWNEVLGFLPALSLLLPAEPFTDAGVGQPFQRLLESGSRLGLSLAAAWHSMQQEVGADSEGPLQQPVANAGHGTTKLQKALTDQREKVRFQQLDAEIRQLPPGDVRRMTWLSLDKFSTVWVSAWPTRDTYLSNPEFGEVAASYFALPSPACQAHVGQVIGRSREILDRHGLRLTTATLPGDGWRTQHDVLKWRLTVDAAEMGVRCRTEVYGLFAACIPQQGRALASQMPSRKRQGLVPDFMFTVAIDGPERELLFELKTLHAGPSTYGGSTHRGEAVARRARVLPAEYARKARGVDQCFCGTPIGNIGPVEAKLRTYDPVRGLVFGAFGEASPDVERLLSVFCRTGAMQHWRHMRVAGPSEAQGILAWMLRRRWGMTALREAARLKLERLQFVGRGAAAAADRRVAFAAPSAAARRNACSFWQGPRLPPGGRGDVV